MPPDSPQLSANDQSRRDSTLLSLIAQAAVRGADKNDVRVYRESLSEGALSISDALLEPGPNDGPDASRTAQDLLAWARALRPRARPRIAEIKRVV